MSAKYPIIAITGSSGAGTTSARSTLELIFKGENINAAFVEGDSFHKFTRDEMEQAITHAERDGNTELSHFGPEANLLDKLENLFREYSERGSGQFRHYLHNEEEARTFRQPVGTFTPWEQLPANRDLLFYEGLHGGIQTEQVDVARYVDLLIGVVPIINLEWIQKIHRDMNYRGYSIESVRRTILRRMPDYINYIAPQFSRTHINFQRVPTVDTSNPFVMRDVPTLDESFVVIHCRSAKDMDFSALLSTIQNSFVSSPNSIVVPGNQSALAMQLVLTPMIRKLMLNRETTFAAV